jgi:hypothetical protein
MQTVTNRGWCTTALLLTLAGVAARVEQVRRRRLQTQPRALPQRLQVWEAEGGQNQMPGLPR